jgi:7,8-dihydroneopterin aldolase/epimerase/oxygenase
VTLTVELHGLELQGRHGVEEEERANPQAFLFDLWLDVPADALSDRIEDAVDYREVATCVRQVSEERQFHLLEALAAAVADAIVERFPVTSARVRVRKPGVVLDAPVDYSAATAEASRR